MHRCIGAGRTMDCVIRAILGMRRCIGAGSTMDSVKSLKDGKMRALCIVIGQEALAYDKL